MGFRNPITTAADPTARAAAAAAQSTATSAQTAANGALAVANGKNTLYLSATTPTAPAGGFVVGDEWIDSGHGNALYVWQGGASGWVAEQWGSNAIAAGAVTAGKVAAGAIDAMTITGALLRTAASGARLQLDSTNGLVVYDASGNIVSQLDLSGNLNAIGQLATALAGKGRVRIYNTSSTQGGQTVNSGIVEFGDGVAGDNPATLQSTAILNTSGVLQGGQSSWGGGSFRGVTTGTLSHNVEGLPAGGYGAISRQTGAALVSDTAPPDALSNTLTLNTGAFVAASTRGALAYRDASGHVCLAGLLNNVGAIAQGAGGIIVGNVPAGIPAPAKNRWFLLPIYPLAAVALVGIRTSGSIVLDLLIAGAAAAGAGNFDISVIRYHPTSNA